MGADLDKDISTSDDDARRLDGTIAEYPEEVKETIANLEKVNAEYEAFTKKDRSLKKKQRLPCLLRSTTSLSRASRSTTLSVNSSTSTSFVRTVSSDPGGLSTGGEP